MDPRLDAELGRARLDGLLHPAGELVLARARRRPGERRDWPNPQNAQPTVQMFETLMLRFTTNVTVSPASSRRSSSAAAAHLLDHLRTPLGEQRGQLRLGQRGAVTGLAPPLAARGRRHTNRSARRPEPRRGMNDQYSVLITSITGRATHSGSMYSEYTHSRSVSASPSCVQALADLRRRRERMLRRDVIAVGAQPAEIGGAGARPAPATSQHRFGGTWIPMPGISRRVSAISRFMSSIVTGAGPVGRVELRPVRDPRPPVRAGRRPPRCPPALARNSSGGGRSSGGSPPGCGRSASCSSASASSDAIRSSSVSPIPTRIPLVNGIFSSPAAAIVSIRRAGCLVGEPGVHGLHQPLGHRLQHQPLRGGHLPQPRQVLAAQHAQVRVRQQPPLERPLAHPHHV